MVLDKLKIELRVKKLKVDISTTPRQNYLHGPYYHPQGRAKADTDHSFSPVKGEDYENLANFFKTCLRCLINGAGRLLIFQFFFRNISLLGPNYYYRAFATISYCHN